MKVSDHKSTGRKVELDDKNTTDQPYPSSRRRSSPKKILNRLIPILILFVFAALILRDQIPGIDDKIAAFINPQGFAAIQTCRKAALNQSTTPDFARLIKRGKANPTNNGFFVDQLVLGEMHDQGGERLMEVGCHVDQNGELIKLNRAPYTANPITEETSNYLEHATDAD
jgi:hypothetical protein